MKPYYQDEAVTLYLGDYRQYLAEEKPAPFDFICPDFPYSVTTHNSAKTNAKPKYTKPSGVAVKDVKKLIHFDPWTFAEASAHIEALAPYTKGWIVGFADIQHVSRWNLIDEATLQPVYPLTGLKFIRWGCWFKERVTPQISGDRPALGWESIFMFHRTGVGRMRWYGGGKTAAYVYPIAQGAKRLNDHPTSKSQDLLARLYRDFTVQGDVIFDPTAGGGVHLAVAKRMGRQAVGCEISEEWCEKAAESLSRISTHTLFDAETLFLAEQDTMPVAV